jgi:hydroxymethylpyrimidine/phosphomethylpyrimidine kinase
MKARNSTRVALTVAGSDSGGSAGIQADLKTFHALGVFGTSAITWVTAQNPDRVSAVQPIEPRIVAEQIDRVFEAFRVRAAKTGMLYDAGIIETVAGAFARRRFRRLVVDPVMVSSSGALLLKKDAIPTLTSKLFPLAALVTPNLAEAEALCRGRIRTLLDLRDASRLLSEHFGVAFLVKGGHLPGTARAVDVLWCSGRLHEFSVPRVPKIKTHGTGCVYSAAITAHLALGCDLVGAVGRAKILVTKAIRDAVRVGKYRALRL